MKEKRMARRQFFVKKHLQFYYALTSLVLMLTAVMSTWYLMHVTISTLIADQGLLSDNAAIFLDHANRTIWYCMIGSAIAVFFMTLFFTRHIAGPLYKMEQAMGELIDKGKTAPLSFRRHDLLHETGAIFNQLIAAFKKR